VVFLVEGSLSAFSQILIYFFWPIYLYVALRAASAFNARFAIVARRGTA
jgi:hypothetical protein